MKTLPPPGIRQTEPQHDLLTIIGTNLEADVLPSGLSKAQLLKSLDGQPLAAASLVLRFAH